MSGDGDPLGDFTRTQEVGLCLVVKSVSSTVPEHVVLGSVSPDVYLWVFDQSYYANHILYFLPWLPKLFYSRLDFQTFIFNVQEVVSKGRCVRHSFGTSRDSLTKKKKKRFSRTQ